MRSIGGLVKSVAFRTGTEAFKKLVNLGFVVFVARKLGAEGLGRYSFLLVLTSILGIIADCGFSTLMLREIATRRNEARRLLGASIIMKSFLSGVTFGLVWVVIRLLHSSASAGAGSGVGYTEAYLFAAYSVLLSFMEMFNAFFVVDQRLDLDAVTNVIQRGGAVLLGIALVLVGMNVEGIGLAFAVATGVAAIVALWMVGRRFGSPVFRIKLALCKSLLKEAVPLALTLFFSAVYFKIDQVMLGWMRSETELGWYSAAYRVFEVTALIPSILMLIVLPVFSRLAKESKEVLVRAGQQMLALLLTLGIAVSVVVALAAPRIVALFGRDFGLESSEALSILIWTAVPIFCNFVLTTILITIGRQTRLAHCFMLGAALNIALNWVAIPRWGYLGAAWSTVVTELVLFGLVVYFLGRYLSGWKLRAFLLRPLASALLAAGIALVLGLGSNRPVFAAVWLAMFGAGIVALRAINLRELALLRGIEGVPGHSSVGNHGDRG